MLQLNPESAMWATGDVAEVEIDSGKNKKNQETNAIMKNQVEAAWVNVVVGQAFTSEEINTDMLENAEDADLPTGLMATSAARIFVPFFKGTHYGSVFRYTDNQNYGNIAKPFCAYAANDPFAIAACTKASVTGESDCSYLSVVSIYASVCLSAAPTPSLVLCCGRARTLASSGD